MTHTIHHHVRIGAGVVWCPETKLVYIRVDDLSGPAKKPRPDDGLLFARTWKSLAPLLRKHKLPVLGWVMIDATLRLPQGVSDFPDLLSWVRARDISQEGSGE